MELSTASWVGRPTSGSSAKDPAGVSAPVSWLVPAPGPAVKLTGLPEESNFSTVLVAASRT